MSDDQIQLAKRCALGVVEEHTMMVKAIDVLTKQRNEARSNARVLAHSYKHDADPPRDVVDESLAYPVDNRSTP